MSDDTALDLGIQLPAALIPAPRPRVTEADMLALLNTRYDRTYANGAHEALRYVGAPHVRLQPGFSDKGKQRIADYIAIDTWATSGHALHGHEVKVSRSDLLSELRQPEKAQAFARYCDYWWLVLSDRDLLNPSDPIPEGWGVMSIVGHGSDNGPALRVARPAARNDSPHPLPSSLVASFARSVAHRAIRAGVA